MTKPRKSKTDTPHFDQGRGSSQPDQSTDGSEQPSRTFQVGFLYEKYNGQGVSKKDFVNLLTDLGEPGSFSWQSGGQSVLFDAGRLFQKYAVVDDGFIKEPGFISLIRGVNICAVASGRCENDQHFVPEFTAGRAFQTFAESRPTVGLTKREFELLLSNSPVGARIHQMAVDLLDNYNPNPDANGQATESMPTSTLPLPGAPHAKIHSLTPSYASRIEQGSASSASSWGKEMRELERLRQEIMAYERELQAETSLRKELPEAYSASKEKILRQNIQALEKRHESISSSLFSAMQYVQNQPTGYLHFPQPTHYRTLQPYQYSPYAYGSSCFGGYMPSNTVQASVSSVMASTERFQPRGD